MTDIKKGDRVKVTIEGEVVYAGTRSVEVRTDDGKVVEAYTPSSTIAAQTAVEKIEPPVEVFKPGDIVRSKDKRDPDLRVITRDGWVNLKTGCHYVDGAAKPRFTSDIYEKVDLSAVS